MKSINRRRSTLILLAASLGATAFAGATVLRARTRAARAVIAHPPEGRLIPLPGARLRPELRDFIAWVRGEAAITRAALGDVPASAPVDAPPA